MQDEMADHIEKATERLIARGLSPIDAHLAATREFGSMTHLKEEGRRARGTRWLEALAADSRFASRHFRRNPGATITMLLVLGLGMSFGTALFSFMHAYMTQPPLGVARSDDLVRIRGRHEGDGGVAYERQLSREELAEYQGLTSHFAAVAGFSTSSVSIALNGEGSNAEAGTATFVTPNYFDVLGVRPIIGAGLPRTEDASAGTQPIAVIAYAVWEKFFARSPSVLGATLTVDGVPVTIVGVAPPRFAGLTRFYAMTIWMPIANRPLIVPQLQPGTEVFTAAARLAPGMDMQRATAAVQVIAQRSVATIDATRPASEKRRGGADVVPLLAMNAEPQFDREPGHMRIGLAILGSLVLLITCTNVSALQTGLAMMRRREIAIRLSMGASRRRIIRQLLTETIILATLASAMGLGFVWLFQRLALTRMSDSPIELAVSAPAMAFAFGLSLIVGVLFGLSPALHATRLTVSSALKDSSGAIAAPRVRLQRALVVAQITLTQPLIVGLGLMIVSLSGQYQRLGLNENADRIVSVRLRPAGELSQRDAAAEWASETRALRDRLRTAPFIDAVARDPHTTFYPPYYVAHPDDRIGGETPQPLDVTAPMVAPGYFRVMGMRIIAGRDFTETERTPLWRNPRAEVPVIIGSDLADKLWRGANPIGRRLVPADADSSPRMTVVGVVEQPRDKLSGSSNDYRIFIPPDSNRVSSALGMLIRTTSDARAMLPAIRRAVEEATPRLAIADTHTQADTDLETRKLFTLAASGLGTAGLLVLVLAAIGLYAVVSFAVGQRTSEIAVRMAVGAGQLQIMRKFVGEGVRLGIIGLVIGLPLSYAALRLIMMSMKETLPPEWIGGVTAAAGVIALTVALAATLVPARRAAGVDPATVLRRD